MQTKDTKDFKTRTIMNPTPFPGREDKWVIGLDIGYSAVKGISQNGVWCFPSLVKQIEEDRLILKAADKTDIRYKDKSGTWVVGNLAYDEATSGEVIISESEFYSITTYLTQQYRVKTAVGIALGLKTNSFGSPDGKEIVIQTGLPPKYLVYEHEDGLRDGIEGVYDFELSVGGSKWEHYHFEIKRDNIHIMAQPLGALISASVSKNGKPSAEAKKYFSSDVIVIDPGFGTVDTYYVHLGNVIKSSCETFNDLGMKEVFERTCKEISDKFRKSVTITDLQTRLNDGTVKIVNKKEMTSQLFDFSDILNRHSLEVCSEVIEKMKRIYDYFSRTDYIIATGGTYEAWKEVFEETFKPMNSLSLIPANVNDTSLSNIFSNVRGYYFFRRNAKS